MWLCWEILHCPSTNLEPVTLMASISQYELATVKSCCICTADARKLVACNRNDHYSNIGKTLTKIIDVDDFISVWNFHHLQTISESFDNGHRGPTMVRLAVDRGSRCYSPPPSPIHPHPHRIPPPHPTRNPTQFTSVGILINTCTAPTRYRQNHV